MRKILGILLALSLALFLSVPALAASGDVAYLAYNAATGEFDPQTKAAGEYTVVTGRTTAWSAGWYVVSENVTIPNRITVSGDVHLILADGCTLTASKGITVAGTNSLTIYGQTAGTGTLTTGTPNDYYAGIGGNSNQSSGLITINGGVVEAKGGSQAAGIGGGTVGSGTVTINGGTVNATGGSSSAGIGSGSGSGRIGTVTINGGTVNATGGNRGAGIGGGYKGSGTVTINGGTVNATGGGFGAGIGGGMNGSGTVTISGGVVIAKGGSLAAGIGGGDSGIGTVTISGGVVNATGTQGAGIGGGYGKSGTVTISGGIVNATSTQGAGIGNGSSGSGSSFSTTAADDAPGNAFIVASSISDASTKENWSGVIIIGSSGQVYGSPTLTTDATVPNGITLTIPAGSTLTIDGDATLTNNNTINVNGTLTIDGDATLTNNGTITVEDTLQNDSTIMNNGTINGTVTGSGRIIVDGNIVIDENSTNQGGTASLAHEVAPAYTVTIPSGVTIGNTATVKAEGVRVDYGKQVVVRLGSGSALTVALEGDATETLAYTVSVSGQKVAAGGAVLAVNPANATGDTLAGGTATLSFALADTAVVKYSGSYTGTVTFTVSVETVPAGGTG